MALLVKDGNNVSRTLKTTLEGSDLIPHHIVDSGLIYAYQAGTWSVSGVLAVGAATEASLQTIIGHVNGIEALLTAIEADTTTLAATVGGTEVQVDIVAALPTGDNTIGRVKITDGTTVATIRELGANDALNVSIVDGAGNQITSFGGGTAASGVQYTENEVDTTITGTAAMMEATGNILVPLQGSPTDGLLVNLGNHNDVVAIQSGTWNINNIAGTISLPNGASTLAEQQTQTTHLSNSAISLSVIDDWDESDRAKVNPIVGQAGVAAGTGIVSTNTQRVVLASDDLAVQSLQLLDNAVAGNELQVDVVTMPTVTVQSTNLDIRDLTAASDSVSVHGNVGIVNQLDLTNTNPITVAIVDDNGNQIISFGGSGSIPQYIEGDTDTTIAGVATLMEGAGNTLLPIQGTIADGLLVNLGANNDVIAHQTGIWSINHISGTISLPQGASTLAEQQSQTTHLSNIAASLSVVDDWDETDRAKVNPIVGQAGVAAGAGNVSATVQRMTLAADDPAVTSLQLLDNAVAGNEFQVDVITMPTVTVTATNLDVRDLSALQDGVFVSGVLAGTGLLHASKAENATWASGAAGTLMLGVRNDANVPQNTGDLRYNALSLDNLNHLRVGGSHLTSIEQYTLDMSVDIADIKQTHGGNFLNGDHGVPIYGVQQTTASGFDASNGDYIPLSVDPQGRLYVNTGGVGNGVLAAQSGIWSINHVSGTISLPQGAATLAEQQAQSAFLSTIDTNVGTLTDLVKVEDVAAGDGFAGTPIFGVRNDSAGTMTSNNGDFGALSIDSVGRLGVTSLSGTLNVSGTVIANAGLNLNTSLLALETGGNLASAATSLALLDNTVAGNELQVDVITMPTVTVQATNLDIRDLVAASDAVSIHGDVGIADQLDLTNSNPFTVAIVDGAGDQITSFGGGTQYTEGDVDTTITGTAVMWEDSGNTLRAVSSSFPLPITGSFSSSNLHNHTLATGHFTSNGQSIVIPVSGYNSLTLGSSGTYTNLQLITEGSVNGGLTYGYIYTQWSLSTGGTSKSYTVTAGAATLLAQANVAGMTHFRLRSASITGTGYFTLIGTTAQDTTYDVNAQVQGAVDVNTVTPGTASINLGKAIDQQLNTDGTDVGVMTLALRKDNPTSLATVDEQYTPFISDANGRLYVNVGTGILSVTGVVTANAGTNLNTSLLALETGGNLAAAAASLSVVDDWDETDRAKVNIIVGQAGVAAGAGSVSATVQRMTLASDDPAVTALQLLDNAVAGNEFQVDVITMPTTTVTATNLDIRDLSALADSVYVSGVLPGSGHTQLGKLQAAVWSSGAIGTLMIGVRNDADHPMTTGDMTYNALSLDNLNHLKVGGSYLTSIEQYTLDLSADFADVKYTHGGGFLNGDHGLATYGVRQDSPSGFNISNGDYTPFAVDPSGCIYVNNVGSSSAGIQYTEGDTDSTITGTAILWEDAADRLRPVSALRPLPVSGVFPSSVHYSDGATIIGTTVGQMALMHDGSNIHALRGNSTNGLTVNLGTNNDVEVTSIIPGTGANNLAKKEDNGHTSGDVGVMALAVRQDSQTPLAGDGDYIPLTVNSAGSLHTTVTSGLPAGTNVIGKVNIVDGGGTVTSVFDLTNNEALAVAIVDGNGDQITSFGGGTQYTEGDTDATIVGTAIMWEDASNTLRPVSSVSPLPISGIFPSGVHYLEGGSVIGTIRGQTLLINDGVSFYALRGDSSNGLLVNLGSNNDVIITTAATGLTSLAKAEDGVAGNGGVGIAALGVRNDNATTLAGSDGDFSYLATDAAGRIGISDLGGSITVDVASAITTSGLNTISVWDQTAIPSTSGLMTFGVRRDADTTPVSTDGDYHPFVFDDIGNLKVTVIEDPKNAGATLSNVAGSASSTTILSSNTARIGATVFNDSGAGLLIKFGTTASATSYTMRMDPSGYYEVPFGYTGRIDGIWSAATGNARVTELTKT